MSESKSYSNRHRKRVIQKGLRELKNKPGWDVSTVGRADGQQQLRQFDQDLRKNQVYKKAQSCKTCLQVREDTADNTALCSEHLADVMGLDGD